MPQRKNIFGFAKSKVTYHREVGKERRELKRQAMEDRRERLALKKQEAAERAHQDREDAIELKRAEMQERKDKAARKRADAVDRKIEQEMREQGTRNPKTVTDRAKRYRAHVNAPDGPKRCYFCPSRKNIDLHHISGNEDDGAPENLTWACRPCNVRIANVMRKAGLGKKTAQYNPAGGATTLGQWMNAVQSMKGEAGGEMQVADAVAMIRATSKNKRSEFAHDIWGKRYARRRNPDLTAAEMAEAWHGKPATTETEYIERVKYHGKLAELARLMEVKVWVDDRHVKAVIFDKNTKLGSNVKGEQLYVVGGDQSLNVADFGITGHAAAKDLIRIGPCYSVTYWAAKHHLGKADKIPGPYEHVFSEHGEEEPDLLYDTMNSLVQFAGGEYFIDPTDYDGSHSAGIRN